MRLRKFEIRNFKGIGSASFEWDEIVVLIGENNVGKSTVLQALELFLSGSQPRDEAVFFNRLTDDDHAIELVGTFDLLTASEQQAQAVRGRMLGEEWIIKKRFWAEEGDGDRGRGGPWKEQYFSWTAEEQFVEWPTPDNAWGNFPAEYKPLIDELPEGGSRPNAQTREALKELVRQRRPDLVELGEPDWVPNPGGGGNWKSNANSVVPKLIFVRAVHDASQEAVSKEASTYGKILDLIIERRLMQRPEVQRLREQIDIVLDLFRPDPEHPERQAAEVRELEDRINDRLNQVIGGVASIETDEPDIRPILLPNTELMVRESEDAVKTPVIHQGQGLQRTLIMALLQVWLETQSEGGDGQAGLATGESDGTPIVLAVEEPELYMHPQMQRKMRDALYRLASQGRFQVICTTHSPVFIDVAERQRSLVRIVKDVNRRVDFLQVGGELYQGEDAQAIREQLKVVSQFHPTVNEVFFARRVVLLEECSAIAAFERAAELTGLYERNPALRRDITMVDCVGKTSIPLFQRVLNHFSIPYTVVHDEDRGNSAEVATNRQIQELLNGNCCHLLGPTNLEGLLNYAPVGRGGKPYQAVKRVEELHRTSAIPADFLRALNFVYFGQESEPEPAV